VVQSTVQTIQAYCHKERSESANLFPTSEKKEEEKVYEEYIKEYIRKEK